MMNYRDRRCPHCGRTTGLYTLNGYVAVKNTYDFQGNFVDESFDNATHRSGKRMYCQTCDKYVCNIKDYDRLFGEKKEGKSNG